MSLRVRFIFSRSINFIENEYAKYFIIPQRYIVTILASLAVLILMQSRSYIEVIITDNSIYIRNNDTLNDSCPIIEHLPEIELPNKTFILLFDWNVETKHSIQDAYFWGHILGLLPGGFITDQFGGKYIATISMLLSSFCLIMLPGIIDIKIITDSVTASAVIIGRFLQGLFHGPLYPGLMTVLARWVPISQRTAMITCVFGIEVLGDQLGHVIHFAFIDYSWRPGFYFVGGMGILWCIFWHFLIYPSPWDNPFVKKNELMVLEEEIDENIFIGWKDVPWLDIVFSQPVWALIILNCGTTWGWLIFLSVITTYVPIVLKGEVLWHSVWWLAFFLYFGLAYCFGFISDWFFKDHHLSGTTIRKIFITIANGGPAVCMIFICFEKCNLDAIMIWYMAALCLGAAYHGSVYGTVLDMTTNYVGILTGIVFANGYIMFCLAPHLTSYLTSEGNKKSPARRVDSTAMTVTHFFGCTQKKIEELDRVSEQAL